jgi:ubiquitin
VTRSGIEIYLKQIGQREPSRRFKAEGKHYDVIFFRTRLKRYFESMRTKESRSLIPWKPPTTGPQSSSSRTTTAI